MEPKKETQKPRERATIGDVAKEAGVSKTTISRYLSGDYKSISEATLERIHETVARLRYRPNRMARGLKQDRSYSIGMIFADISNPYSTSVMKGAEDACTSNGYSMIVCNTDNDPVKEKNYIAMMQAHRIDGLIIHPTGHYQEGLNELSEDRVPVVLIDRKLPDLPFDVVTTAHYGSAREVVKLILDEGYERIALFSQPIHAVTSRLERYRGFVDGLREAGRPGVNDLYEFEYRSQEQLDCQLERFLQDSAGQERMILAANGITQLKLINALRERGLRLPEDLGMAGFDDADWSPIVGPGITCVAQPTYEIGKMAMERVLARIAGDEAPGQVIEFPGKIIKRGSILGKSNNTL